MQKPQPLYLKTRVHNIVNRRGDVKFDKMDFNSFIPEVATEAKKRQQEREVKQCEGYQTFSSDKDTILHSRSVNIRTTLKFSTPNRKNIPVREKVLDISEKSHGLKMKRKNDVLHLV